MENLANTKVGEIVTRDFRTAGLFKKSGIDFCCGGNQTLEDACKAQNLDLEEIQDEILKLERTTVNALHNFNDWKLDFLCDYIVNTHHQTVKRLIPELTEYTQKIARVHGANHPELVEIEQLFAQLSSELLTHLQQEEDVLFPTVKENLKKNSGELKQIISTEINRMSGEHEFAGSTMDKINKLSDAYSLPPDACNTYKLTFKLLEEFEDDLHIHVHLENNILYPKALNL